MEPLKPLEKITEPDGRWDTFKLSLPRLHEIAESMTLNECVPEYVRVQFQQAQHLLIYSYLQFSLLSVALMQALVAVEFALRTRWESSPAHQLTQHKSLPGMKKLLELAFEEKWIEDLSSDLITLLPTLRNASAHGEYALNPIGTLEMVRMCGKMIQQMYPWPSEIEPACVNR